MTRRKHSKESNEFLSSEHIEQIRSMFSQYKKEIGVRTISSVTGFSRSESLAIIAVLSDMEICNPFRQIFHTCDNYETAFALIPMEEGIPNLPIICSLCESEIDSLEELAFDIICRVVEDKDAEMASDDQTITSCYFDRNDDGGLNVYRATHDSTGKHATC
jgi:hypothetical protein